MSGFQITINGSSESEIKTNLLELARVFGLELEENQLNFGFEYEAKRMVSEAQPQPKTKIGIEDVRKALSIIGVSKAREVLKEFEVKKITDLPPHEYSKVLRLCNVTP